MMGCFDINKDVNKVLSKSKEDDTSLNLAIVTALDYFIKVAKSAQMSKDQMVSDCIIHLFFTSSVDPPQKWN